MRRGVVLRLTACGDDANVAALFYSREQPLERYNMADTLKAQHIAHLTTGCVCYSDMGRILCSITADTCGWHDPLCGLTDAALIAARYGATRFQEQRNQRYVSGRDAMLVELGKYGLGERDLVANINFFSKVVVDEAGALQARGGPLPGPASTSTCASKWTRSSRCTPGRIRSPPRTEYAPPAIRLQARRGTPPAADDPCRTRCPENARGYINTERMYAS